MLYIVGTPIGNLQDMSPRAITTLKSCDLILAEDTRHSMHLLKHFLISTPIRSYHQYNEQLRSEEILLLLHDNKNIALITDAGMPTISDPGYILINKALKQGIKLSVVPGPTAITSAVSISGINCHQFCYAGFLDSREKARLSQLASLQQQNPERAIVLYEAPHRIIKCLNSIKEIFGDEIVISVIKEITKQYENVYHGTVLEIINRLSQLDSIRGEYVIVIDNNTINNNNSATGELSDQEIKDKLALLLSEGLANATAVKLISKLYKVNKNRIYKLSV